MASVAASYSVGVTSSWDLREGGREGRREGGSGGKGGKE